MYSVQRAIQDLRTQIEEALIQEAPLPSGVQLAAETVTLSLGLALDPAPKSNSAWRLSGPGDHAPPAHTLTVQFRLQRASLPAKSSAEPFPGSEPTDLTTAPMTPRERLEHRCQQAFGPPGFDNSARAEVFSEILSRLPPAELVMLLEWCRAGTRAPGGHPLQGKLGQLRRVLNFAPVGEPAAAEILLQLVGEYTPREIGQVLGERWRFGTHWVLPGEG